MPVDVVDIDLSAATGAVSKPTYSDVVVVGTETAANEPSEGFDTPGIYSTASQVSIDYGDLSDVHIASQALDEMGAERWHVIVLESVDVSDENVGGNSSSTDTGLLENVPVSTDANVSIDVDSSPVPTVIDTAESPPDKPDSGEVALNRDTGELVLGDSTSGSGAGIVANYSYTDFSGLVNLEGRGIDIMCLANTRMGAGSNGDLNNLAAWASGNNAVVIGACENGNTAADDSAAMDAAHELGSYVPSGDVMLVAHKSSEDVAATICGQLAVHEPWFDPFYDGDGYPIATEYFREALVGDPGTTGTFEGGDDDGTGPVNVLINKQGTVVLSNSITTAGDSSNYQFLDVGRTESYIANEIERSLTSLRLRADQIPYTGDGRAMIKTAIDTALQQNTGGLNSPLRASEVMVPKIVELPEDDRANRVFTGISVEGTLAGNVHTFDLTLNVTV